MKKKWATSQSCFRKEVTSYKIHTLDSNVFFCKYLIETINFVSDPVQKPLGASGAVPNNGHFVSSFCLSLVALYLLHQCTYNSISTILHTTRRKIDFASIQNKESKSGFFLKEKKRNPSASPIVTLVTCVHSVQQCNGSYMKKISALQEKSPPVEKK